MLKFMYSEKATKYMNFSIKVVLKLKLQKNHATKKNAPKLSFFNEKKSERFVQFLLFAMRCNQRGWLVLKNWIAEGVAS